jgi:hypothetical protein
MDPFLDLILINTYPTHASYDYVLYDSMKVREATAIFYPIMTVKILRSFHAKGMRIVSIVGDGLSLQRVALSDEDRVECR